MSDNEIGKKILARRKQLGLTLEDVGKSVGVGKSTVRKWENGMIKNMRGDKISALAVCVRKTIMAKGEPRQVAGSLGKRQKNW